MLFYLTLNILKCYQIDPIIINKLDAWLGTRRRSVWHSLNPLQFSIDTDMDEDYALYLFSLCTMQDIQLLKTRYSVVCPVCENYIKSYEDAFKIENNVICQECETNISIIDEYVEVYFELLREPDNYPYKKDEIEKLRVVTSEKKRVAFAYQQ